MEPRRVHSFFFIHLQLFSCSLTKLLDKKVNIPHRNLQKRKFSFTVQYDYIRQPSFCLSSQPSTQQVVIEEETFPVPEHC